MRILSITPAASDGSGRFQCVAIFDAEIGGTLRLYNLRLLRSPDGKHRTYAQSKGGKRVATFAPELADQLTAAATAALKGRAANDRG